MTQEDDDQVANDLGDGFGEMGDLGGDLEGAMGEDAGDGGFGGAEFATDLADIGDETAAAQPITPGAGGDEVTVDRRKKAVLGVPIEVIVAVGRARPLLSELVNLRRDSVLPLDSKIDDPVEIMIGDRVIARGELQEIDSTSGRLGVRLTEVADLSQSL